MKKPCCMLCVSNASAGAFCLDPMCKCHMGKNLPHTKLNELSLILSDISGYWNGKDETFIGGDGEIHHEEQAIVANEAVELIEKLKPLLEELKITY